VNRLGAFGVIALVYLGLGCASGGGLRGATFFPGGGGSGHTVKDEGTPLTARSALECSGAGITCTDDAGNNETDIIVTGEPPDDSVTAAKIPNDAVGATEIATDAVGAPEIATDGVTSAEIVAGAVGTSELADTAVTPGTYGTATATPQCTFDADGRATSCGTVMITPAASNVPMSPSIAGGANAQTAIAGVDAAKVNISDAATSQEGATSPVGVLSCSAPQCIYFWTSPPDGSDHWVCHSRSSGTAGWKCYPDDAGFWDPISSGLFSKKASKGTGFTTVSEVWIAPTRASTSDHPDGDALCQAAWNYCVGVTSNDFDNTGPNSSNNQQKCQIRWTSGIYEFDNACFLEQDTASENRSPIDIDFNGAILAANWPAPDGASTVAGLGTCDAGTAPEKGDTCEVTDPLTIDDVTVGGAPGASTITSIDSDVATCPQKYGVNTVLITTAAANTFQDAYTTVNSGNQLQLPTLVRVQGTATYQPGRDAEGLGIYPVTWAKDSDEFCVKTSTAPPVAPEATGTVKRLNTLAWYDGEIWHAGQPMIAVGGPDSQSTVTNVALRNFVCSYDTDITDSRSIRSPCVRLNANTLGSAGGYNGVTIERVTLHSTNAIRGQVGIDVGGREVGEGRNVIIDRINADPFPASHSPIIWTRNIADFDYRAIYAVHGGGLWFGEDSATVAPHSGNAQGTIQGIKDGPGVIVWSGNNLDLSRLEVASSVNGPLNTTPQSDAGLVGIFGGTQSLQMTLSMPRRIDIAAQTDLDCYIHLGDIDSATSLGGIIKKGTGSSAGVGSGSGWSGAGQGAGYVFCSRASSDIGRFVIRDAAEMDSDTGELVPLMDLVTAPPASADFICPNCESTETVEWRYGDASPAAWLANVCLSTLPGSDGGACTASTHMINEAYHPFGSGRSWIHDLTCATSSSVSLADGDSQVLEFIENVNDGATAPAVITGATATFNGLTDPGQFTTVINRATTGTSGLMGLRFQSVSGGGTETAVMQCTARRSTLVQ
jgi:hypothetical protein